MAAELSNEQGLCFVALKRSIVSFSVGLLFQEWLSLSKMATPEVDTDDDEFWARFDEAIG